MAELTTPRKIVWVVGPGWWGDPYLTRAGQPTPLRPAETRAGRRVEAADEVRGLHDRLDRLPEDCAIAFVAGSGGAADRTALWAAANDRLPLIVTDVDGRPGSAFDLMGDVVAALQAAGSTVAVFVCDTDPGGGSLTETVQARGLSAWPVHPLALPPPAASMSSPTGKGRQGKKTDPQTEPETPEPATTNGAVE